jgi:hypothetical protein
MEDQGDGYYRSKQRNQREGRIIKAESFGALEILDFTRFDLL